MPSTGYVPTRERMDGASCSATVTRMPEGKGRPPGTRRIPAASRSKWSPRPPLRDHLPKGDGGGEDDRAETRQGRTTGQKLGTTGRRCGNSAGPGSRSRLELGERSVAKQQPLSPVRRLEGHLDLRLLALSRDLADRPHSEGIMRDPVADGQLRHLRSRDRFAPRPEAGTVDVPSATAQPSAEGGPAPAAVPCPEGASPTVAAGGGEAGTASRPAPPPRPSRPPAPPPSPPATDPPPPPPYPTPAPPPAPRAPVETRPATAREHPPPPLSCTAPALSRSNDKHQFGIQG